MEAIILVGGLGTRLGGLTKSTPKPMLLIRGKPFLEHQLEWLKTQGINRVVLAVGYLSSNIKQYFDKKSCKLPEIIFSCENTPLGTGGALALAIEKINTDNFILLNGDSFIKLDVFKIISTHLDKSADITIATKFLSNSDRYGLIEVDNKDRVIAFKEKISNGKSGLINVGLYVINTNFVSTLFKKYYCERCSFEIDILANEYSDAIIMSFVTDGYFIDIGVKEDYERAQLELLFSE
jgi:D-glycero-alpha-D-manno-heptose 1-phosphate guanylyltransferase